MDLLGEIEKITHRLKNHGTDSTAEWSAFKSWGKGSEIGLEVEIIDKKQQVAKVWCKLCRRNSKAIQSYSTCKGSCRKAMLACVYFI